MTASHCLAALLGAGLTVAAAPILTVPPGFSIKPVAGPPAINFPMFIAHGEPGHLFVIESSGNDLYAELKDLVRHTRVSLLEDRDGDGSYEGTRVFADKLAPSMGLAWAEKKLFLADPPELVTLEDTDGDGRADRRTVVLSGFGHRDNGSLHGLIFGPDGWLYFTMGDPDGYDLTGPDGSRARGGTGALIRCRPDGSRVEVVARGFENLVEIAFLPDGSIIGTVNWYQLPDRGSRDALVQILEGSQFPLHAVDARAPHLQFNGVLPPLALFPAVAHSGLELYRGRAFPPELQGRLFSAEHNTRKIVSHRLSPQNASYAVETSDFVATSDPDVHFSDVLEDRDGSLLVVDTGSWYIHHCPTGRIRQSPVRGGLYRVIFASGARSTRSPTTPPPAADLLGQLKETNAVRVAAAARLLGRRGETNAAPALAKLLRSPEPSLRLAAAEALAHAGDRSLVPALIAALAADIDPFLEHALIFALTRWAGRETLLAALNHAHPRVQRAALLLLDQPPLEAAPEPAVVARLNVSDPRLRDTARWVLLRHPDWGGAGAAFLQSLVEQPNPTEADWETLSQFLPKFQTNALVLSAIKRALVSTNRDVNDSQRARLLEAIATLTVREAIETLAASILELLEHGSSAVCPAAIRACATLRIAGAEPALAAIGHTPARPAEIRVDALRELVRRRPTLAPEVMEFLLGRLAATNLATARLAAAETLTSAKLSSSQWIAYLGAVGGDAMISPGLALRGIERNGVDPESAEVLLNYLSASLDAGWTTGTDSLAKLEATVPLSLRARARALQERAAAGLVRQRRQLEEFEPLLRGGDRLRGQQIFYEKAQCTTCHRVWGNGGQVGPDLTRVGAIRAGRDLLESLVLPSASIAQGYDTWMVTTKDGENYSGTRVGDGENPFILRQVSGAEVKLRRADIESIERSPLSLMPDGLLRALSSEEIRDLLAFLQQLK